VTSAQTEWRANHQTPLRQFLQTETGSAAILATAAVAALAWANAATHSYEAFWGTAITIKVGTAAMRLTLREFVNSGLMAFFFLVVGLEARREIDMGELRTRSRLTLPVMSGLAGMVFPICIYLAFNAGTSRVHGWGTTMNSDTAFALGALALAGKGLPDRVRTFLLTVSIADDLLSLVIIAVVYSGSIHVIALLIGLALLAAFLVLRLRGNRNGLLHLVIGIAAWIAFWNSGVDPIVVGLVMGLLTYASPASRADLEQASDAFRMFREQPTAELAREARLAARTAISPNDRLQLTFHPAASYVIVPLFALANTNIQISGGFLARAYTSPVTIGIIVGYLVGKPLGIVGVSFLATRLSKGRLEPLAGWGAVSGTGSAAAMGFTVSFLIASLAFTGTLLGYAKLGILTALVAAAVITWAQFRVIGLLSPRRRLLLLYGRQESITDLIVPVDPSRDHVRGPEENALVTLVEYGDFECPYCGQAEPVVRELIKEYGELRFVFRHLPLTDVHPRAQMAAEAAEAAARQGKFWEMHDTLMDHQGDLTFSALMGYAHALDLDTGWFETDLREHTGADRVAQDVESADLATVSGTPTFFINGRRYYGAFDLMDLKRAVGAAKAEALINALTSAGTSTLEPVASNSIAITGGRVVPIQGEPIEGGTVVLSGGRIEAVLPSGAAAPGGCEVIDATGKWVLPGFLDAHTHLGVYEDGMGWAGTDTNELTGPNQAQVRAVDAINPADIGFRDAIAGGVLAVNVQPGSGNPIGGQTAAIRCWGRTVEDMLLRAPSGLKSALGENPKRNYGNRNETPATRLGTASVIRSALVAAQNYLAGLAALDGSGPGNADYGGDPAAGGLAAGGPARAGEPAKRDLRLESLGLALRREIPWRQHCHRADDIATALRISAEFGTDLVIDHGTEAHLIADVIAARGVPVVIGPLLTARSKVELRNRSLASPGLLAAAGVKIALTTDHPVVPIHFLVHSATFAVREGLAPAEALRSITIAPARILGVSDRLGSLEPGKDADLVIWSGDPLDVMSRAESAFIGGREVYRYDHATRQGTFATP
jgi:Na+/H+ antiporter NhaA